MPAFTGPFKIILKVISATLDRSTDMMGKMDPYVIVEFTRGAQSVRKFKGPTHKGGHKNPKWDWECDMYYGGETGPTPASTNDTLKLVVFEEDVTSSDLVAETATFNLKDILGASNRAQKELPLTYSGKAAGKILIDL